MEDLITHNMSSYHNKTVGILIVSKNRASLKKLLINIFKSLHKKDKIILVLDGVKGEKYLETFDSRLTVIEEEKKGFWGHIHREKYQNYFTTDYILHMDDDDTYVDTWRNVLRSQINIHRPDIIIFNMIFLKNSITFSHMSLDEDKYVPITGNVLFKNTPEIINHPWPTVVGGDSYRVTKMIEKLDLKVFHCDFPLIYKTNKTK